MNNKNQRVLNGGKQWGKTVPVYMLKSVKNERLFLLSTVNGHNYNCTWNG